MLTGLIGKKIGMTQVTDPAGRVRAATVLTLGPCTVSQVKTAATDGYEAVQVTFGKKKLTRVTSGERGHFAKAKIAAGIKSGEFERRGEGELTLGQPIAAADVFKVGDQVDVTGISKGHGYAGVIKRHHFSGFPGSHGTHEYFRHGGSIGNRSYPGRVRKGMRMAGQMGNETATDPESRSARDTRGRQRSRRLRRGARTRRRFACGPSCGPAAQALQREGDSQCLSAT